MARALSSLVPRHLPKRGDSGLPVLAIVAPEDPPVLRPPSREILLPGLGFDLLDLIQMGIALAKDPAGFFAELAESVLGEALQWLGETIGWIFDDIVKFFDDWGWLLACAWSVLEEIPLLGYYLSVAELFFDGFLATIGYWVTGELQHPDSPGPGNLRCPCELPRVDGVLRRSDFRECRIGEEIAVDIDRILMDILPRIYTFCDDTPTVTARYFDEVSILSTVQGLDLSMAYDLIPPMGAEVPDGGIGSPYVRAWKVGSSEIVVEVGLLRTMSYLVSFAPEAPLVDEHEGDSERFWILLDVIPRCGSCADVQLASMALSYHGEKSSHGYSSMHKERDGRVVVGVGRGGHGLYIRGGPWTVGKSWIKKLSVEYAAGPGVKGTDGSVTYRSARSSLCTLSLDDNQMLQAAMRPDRFFDEVLWLYPPTQVHWGADVMLEKPGKSWTPPPPGDDVLKLLRSKRPATDAGQCAICGRTKPQPDADPKFCLTYSMPMPTTPVEWTRHLILRRAETREADGMCYFPQRHCT